MVVIHENTKTSRAVREIENELAGKLKRIAQTIRKDPFFPENLTGLQQKYGYEVSLLIQSAVQRTYMAGIEYVSDFEDIPALLTSEDIQNIQQKTRVEVDAFWRTISRDMLNNQASGLTKAVNIGAAAGLLATAVAFGTLSSATIDKTKQLDAEATVTWITARDERVCPVCRPLHGKTWKVGDSSLLTPIRDTHPNCRCRLLLRDDKSVFSH